MTVALTGRRRRGTALIAAAALAAVGLTPSLAMADDTGYVAYVDIDEAGLAEWRAAFDARGSALQDGVAGSLCIGVEEGFTSEAPSWYPSEQILPGPLSVFVPVESWPVEVDVLGTDCAQALGLRNLSAPFEPRLTITEDGQGVVADFEAGPGGLEVGTYVFADLPDGGEVKVWLQFNQDAELLPDPEPEPTPEPEPEPEPEPTPEPSPEPTPDPPATPNVPVVPAAPVIPDAPAVPQRPEVPVTEVPRLAE